jgi:hypothetical protein
VNPSIDYTITNVPLDAAITQMLQPHGLAWEVTPEGIVITTEEVVNAHLAGVTCLKKSLPNLKKVRVYLDSKGPTEMWRMDAPNRPLEPTR